MRFGPGLFDDDDDNVRRVRDGLLHFELAASVSNPQPPFPKPRQLRSMMALLEPLPLEVVMTLASFLGPSQ